MVSKIQLNCTPKKHKKNNPLQGLTQLITESYKIVYIKDIKHLTLRLLIKNEQDIDFLLENW